MNIADEREDILRKLDKNEEESIDYDTLFFKTGDRTKNS